MLKQKVSYEVLLEEVVEIFKYSLDGVNEIVEFFVKYVDVVNDLIKDEFVLIFVYVKVDFKEFL